MSRRIAIFGGSFNPPGVHHREIVDALLTQFDEVVLIPCGPRPDKRSVNEVEPVHRAAMVDKAFGSLDRVRLELFDLEQATFTPTFRLQERFAGQGELWYAVGSELVKGGSRGASAIQRSWFRGNEVWERLNFCVLIRPGFELDPGDAPPHSVLLEPNVPGASTTVRERVFHNRAIDDLVVPSIRDYIDRYDLYGGGLPTRVSRLRLSQLRPLVIHDEMNADAAEMAASFHSSPAGEANVVIAIGGDGTMLHAIRQHWRLRLPLLGVNAGRRGFLLNDPEEVLGRDLAQHDLILHHLPLLYVEAEAADGSVRQSLAFNDAWVERATAQTAWIEVRVDGQPRLYRLVSDGALLSTAAGSTAYARALGAAPLRADTPVLILAGSNVVEPFRWQSVHLSLDAEVELLTLDTAKRPVRAYADGVLLTDSARRLRVRRSRIAAVELAFAPDHDLTAKLSDLQFPR